MNISRHKNGDISVGAFLRARRRQRVAENKECVFVQATRCPKRAAGLWDVHIRLGGAKVRFDHIPQGSHLTSRPTGN